MEVCQELKSLSKEFNKLGHKLYIVGGFVRNSLMGLHDTDIDITSTLPIEDLNKIIKKLKIKSNNINPRLGTIQLRFNNVEMEYTRFRKESYGIHGKHTPTEIEFVSDIEIDAHRRDFTINSLYYDIEEDRIIDLVGGQKDLQKGIIKTTCDPITTLSDDGLRILRAIRFASTLNFSIHKSTFKSLKSFTPLLNQISKERILKELSLITTSDLKYSKPNTTFLNLCNKLRLPQYIFNSRLNSVKKISKKESLKFYTLNEKSRLVGFYILVLKNYFLGYIDSTQLGYSINMILGRDGIKESLDTIHTTEKIYRIFQNLEYNQDTLNASINYLTLSDSEREIILAYLSKKANSVLFDKISHIKSNNLPLNVHQLDITAQDLIDIGVEKKYISKLLSTLYNQVLNMCTPNEKQELITLAKNINETFNKIKEIS